MSYFLQFLRVLATDKRTNIVQDICLTEQPFFSKITSGCLWNFSFLEVWLHLIGHTAWKVSEFRVISGQCFPVFWLNMDIYCVNLGIQSEYRKKRARNNFVFGHFSRSVILDTRVQSLKESQVATMKSFSIELIKTIIHKCFKKWVFEILEELTRKRLRINTTWDNRV